MINIIQNMKSIVLLICVALLSPCLSTFYLKSLIFTPYSFTALSISPHDGTILVGTLYGQVKYYSTDGDEIAPFFWGSGAVVGIQWGPKYLVIVGISSINVYDSYSLTLLGSTSITTGIKSIATSPTDVAINYGTYVNTYKIYGLNPLYQYSCEFGCAQGGFTSIAYSRNDDGRYLYLVEKGHRDYIDLFTQAKGKLFSSAGYLSVSTHPYLDRQLLINQNYQKIEENSRLIYIGQPSIRSNMSYPIYSGDGNKILAVSSKQSLIIIQNGFQVQNFDMSFYGSSIYALSAARQYSAFVMNSGVLIVIQDDNYNHGLPTWAIILIAIAAIAIVIIILVIVIRKYKLKRQNDIGNYHIIQQNRINQGFNNQGTNNQGFNNQGFNNQGFNNQGFNSGQNTNPYAPRNQPPSTW